MCKTVRQKLEDRLTEYKKEEYVGSFICKECRMYNEYITGTPRIDGNEIVFAYKCENCGSYHYCNE